jgi:nitrate/nitrite transporter NarK
VGWRPVFVIFGLIGVIWVVVWHRCFRDDPASHPGVNAAELALITEGRTPATSSHEGWPYWRRLFAHRNTIPLCLSYIPNSCAFYFCITWLPTFLEEKHGFKTTSLALFSGLPLVAAVAGDLFGGATTDWATRRFGLRIGRGGVAGLGNLLAGFAMIGATQVHSPYAAIGLISLAVTLTMFTLGATWGTCLDIGGAHVGVVSAAMNTTGQIGSVFGPTLVTTLLARTGEWNTPVLAIGGLFIAGATCWLVIDPRDRVFE